MLNWLKYSFGNFFSNKLAKEGKNRKLWNLLFALFMFLVLLTSFLASGYSFSYWTHYSSSNSFKEFAYHTFYNEVEEDRVNIETYKVNDEMYAKAYYNKDSNNVALINTFENESDKKYVVNDYNLIVDTRDSSTTFVKFDVKYYNQNDENDVITADQFRALTGNHSYVGILNIYNELATYSDEDIVAYTSWLNIYVSSLDSSNTFVGQWNEIKALNKNSKIYKDKTYALYNQAYYSLSVTPTIQNYYQSIYAVLDENNEYKYKNYLIITDNWCLISFTSSKGVNVTFDGYYNNFVDGFVLSTNHTNTEEIVMENVDNFFATIFDSVSSIKGLFIGVTVFRFYPYLIIALLMLAAFIYLCNKVKQREYAITYLDGLKISSGFVLISSLFAGLIGFIASFITSQQIAFAVALLGTLEVLMIRILLFVIIEEVNYKKELEMIKINEALGIEEEQVENVKKVEIVKKVSSDDEFKMGKL